MAAPTFAEVGALLTKVVKIIDETENFGSQTATNNLVDMIDDVTENLEGDFVGALPGALEQFRAAVSGVLAPSALRAALEPVIREFGKVINAPETDIPTIMRRLYLYMDANSESVNQRVLSLGSIAGSTTGNGTILRLTTDAYGYQIDAIHAAEVKTFECVLDARQTDEHEEVFQLRGAELERDFLNVIGSGTNETIRAVSARDSNVLLGNPSFTLFTGTVNTSTTAITNWTLASGTLPTIIDTETYRDFVGESSSGPFAASFTANAKLTQIIKDTRNATLDPNTPYWLQAAVFPTTGTSGGNIILSMGSVTRTVALTSLTANQWNIVGILSSPGQNCWLRNFNEADLDIAVEIASLAGGSGVHVDDVLFVPFQPADNQWWLPVPNANANVPWLLEDTKTFTDSVTTEAKIQRALWRAGLGYLPSDNSGTETISDPS